MFLFTPKYSVDKAAVSLAFLTAFSRSNPFIKELITIPLKVSPAPVVSTTFAFLPSIFKL